MSFSLRIVDFLLVCVLSSRSNDTALNFTISSGSIIVSLPFCTEQDNNGA